jgi:hypothetical protein
MQNIHAVCATNERVNTKTYITIVLMQKPR